MNLKINIESHKLFLVFLFVFKFQNSGFFSPQIVNKTFLTHNNWSDDTSFVFEMLIFFCKGSQKSSRNYILSTCDEKVHKFNYQLS